MASATPKLAITSTIAAPRRLSLSNTSQVRQHRDACHQHGGHEGPAAISPQPKEKGPIGRMAPRPAHGDEKAEEGERQISAPGQQLAMGEIGEAQQRIGERHADRAERDDRADHESV